MDDILPSLNGEMRRDSTVGVIEMQVRVLREHD